jgi:hypothetical protein
VGQDQVQEQYVDRPRALAERGWVTAYVLAKDWLEDPEECVARLERLLAGEAPVARAEVAVRPRRTERRGRAVAAVARSVEPEQASRSPGRRFELVGDGSSKFWQVSGDDCT